MSNSPYEVPIPGTNQTSDIVAWEKSPPGSGPTPVYPDLSQDKAVKNGWRYPSPPAAFEEGG